MSVGQSDSPSSYLNNSKTNYILSPSNSISDQSLNKLTQDKINDTIKSDIIIEKSLTERAAEHAINLRKQLPKFKFLPDRDGEMHFFGFSIVGDQTRCFICYIHNEMRVILSVLSLMGLFIFIMFFIANYGFNYVSAADLTYHMYSEGLFIGLTFTIAALFLSLIQIRQHQKNFLHPPSQRHLIWILGMVPVYAVSAFLTLVSLKTSGHFYLYTDFFRVCYEANVIYHFLLLLTKYLGGHNGCVLFLLKKEPLVYPWPLNYCMPPRTSDSGFLWLVKQGCIQYVVIAPIVSLTAIITNGCDVYSEGNFDPSYAYFWCSLIMNFSQLWALYCLVWFYQVLAEELKPFDPLMKFLVVKLIVFFTFWQSIALSIGAKLAIVHEGQGFTEAEVQIGFNSVLICFEMFVGAIAHRYAFPFEVYTDGTLEKLMTDRVNLASEAIKTEVNANFQFEFNQKFDFSHPVDSLNIRTPTESESNPNMLKAEDVYGLKPNSVLIVTESLLNNKAPNSQPLN